MRRIINLRPGRGGIVLWGALPFLMAGIAYAVASSARLAANPNDKLLPQLQTFITAIERLAFNPDPRTGDYLMWVDTIASLERLGIGLAVATAIALVLGVAVGLIPYIRAGLSPFIGVISMIPPMAVLPVLFIVFGLDELSKVVLIVFGVTPFLVARSGAKVGDMPREQLIKAQTLGASTWQIVVRVVLPQMLPRLIDAVRLSLGPAWLFLISAEAIAATEGLGYRIFLVRRYMAMDVILPYVAWITLLAFLSDVGLSLDQRPLLPLASGGKGTVMSRISVKNVWKEYPDQVVLERLSLEIASGEFCRPGRPIGLRQNHFPAHAAGRGSPTRGTIELDGKPLVAEPGPDRGVVFQRYSVFPHLTVLQNVIIGREFERSRFLGKLFGAKRRAAEEEAEEVLKEVGLSAHRDQIPRRSYRAACSSGSPSRRP